MNREDIDKIAVSTGIIFLSGLVLFQSCHRASTIYFFELQTTTVIFIEPIPAFLLPFALSILLWLVYKGTKRSASLAVERKAIEDKRKELETFSAMNSRKPSRDCSRKVSLSEDQQYYRLNRILSDIQEYDTIHSIPDESVYRDSPDGDNKDKAAPKDSDEVSVRMPEEEERKQGGLSPHDSQTGNVCRFHVSSVAAMSMPQLRAPMDTELLRKASEPAPHTIGAYPETSLYALTRSRKSSTGSVGGRRFAGSDVNEDDAEHEGNEIYKQIGQTNLFTYSLSALNLLPKNQPGLPELKLNFSDIMSEFFAVHLPVWGCVAAFYVVILELFGVHFAYYFYYHEETMVYSAFAFSLMFGLFHEFCGGWVTNDILAFSSIYIVCCRIQAVSYQAGLILLVGMAIYDVFWLYVIDLISTVTRECRSPLMIVIPSDHHGNKQSLAAMNIIIPGIFLNVIQKYSSMYDPELFTATYAAVFGALTVTMIFSVWRQKITPGLVLPAIMAVVVSMGLCTHPNDLWRFMIKYKRTMPTRH
ncbi:hypothetical protein KIN20_006719 [Parelaphostrongylus tenuis]|uniref:Signal peptide peptidase n=1 Tax=Parelaphostrongylus tenuis TaxID=148309 RepID=A0AAD5QIK0_PARTN|nr:hypothetical protein KIN20_006719 [Parelaphostrongylus tenuis]